MLVEEALEAAAEASHKASCPGREGPYGGYDYGHNEDFYGKAPEGGRYVIRDFRDTKSPTYGRWVHQTDDQEIHEREFERLTRLHIAAAGIEAYLAVMAQEGYEMRKIET